MVLGQEQGQVWPCGLEMLTKQSCAGGEKATRYANIYAVQAGQKTPSQNKQKPRSLQGMCGKFKVTGLSEVPKGVSRNRKERAYTRKVRDGFKKETGVMFGVLGHLEFDLAKREGNPSTL